MLSSSNVEEENSTSPSQKFDTNQKEQSISRPADTLELKKKRDEYVVEIRRQKREEALNKKRFTNLEMEKKIENFQFTKQKHMQNGIEEDKLNTKIDEWRKMAFSVNDLPGVIKALNSNDTYQEHFGAIALRRLLATAKNPPIQQVIDANLVPRLIRFTERDNEPNLQVEACWALTNIASGTSYEVQTIIDKGGIPAFIRLLKSNIMDIAEQAIWAIGNLSGDSAETRDIILKKGGLDPLLDLIQTSNREAIIKHGTWALSNLTRGRPLPLFELVKKAVPVLAKVYIEVEDPEVLVDAAWSLSYLTEGTSDRIDLVMQLDMTSALHQQLKYQYLPILIPTLRIIGNILTGREEHINKILGSEGLVDDLFDLLNHNHHIVRREASWALSNITALEPAQIDMVIQDEIEFGGKSRIETIISLIYTDKPEIVKECLYLLSNATNQASNIQIIKLCESGVLACFCDFLTADDPKNIEVALDGITNILACGNRMATEAGTENRFLAIFEEKEGLTRVEELQKNSSYIVYVKALSIIETFYDIESAI